MESLLHMAVLGRGRLSCSVVGCAAWHWRFVFALLPRHCQGWSSGWWHVSAGAPVLFLWFGINVRARRNPCRCKTTATPAGAVTSLEAWSRPFSFCPLPSYEGNPRSSLLDRAAAASRRRSPPWRRCLCCSGSSESMLTATLSMGLEGAMYTGLAFPSVASLKLVRVLSFHSPTTPF
jgi:hypothetical protein